MSMLTAELLDRAKAGDGEAFAQLTGPYRSELQVHCYRILGSVHDAEDAIQETMLAAWRGLSGFEGRASIRTWLYRIATSRCLNALRATTRRAPAEPPFVGVGPTGTNEVVWLEPYPDVLLEELADAAPGPEVRYETREAIGLAFVTALQMLPPRQRIALVLRDVLGFRAAEAAHILDITEESVTSALKRARAALDRQPAGGQAPDAPPRPGSPEEGRLVERLIQAYQAHDLDGLIALLSDDVRLRMPPVAFEYAGRDLVREFFGVVAFRPSRVFRLIPTRANRQPAFGVYIADGHAPVFHASGLLVLTLAGEQIRGMTRFDNSVLPYFGLPRTVLA